MYTNHSCVMTKSNKMGKKTFLLDKFPTILVLKI